MRMCETVSGKANFYFSGSIFEGFKFKCGRKGNPSVSAWEIREFFKRFDKGKDYLISTTRTSGDAKDGSMGKFLYEMGPTKSCRSSYFAAVLRELGYIRVHGEKHTGYQFTIVHVPKFSCTIVPLFPAQTRATHADEVAVTPVMAEVSGF